MAIPAERLETAFWAVLAVTLAVRLALAVALPFTSDEAYFYYWGVYPDFGFYDHPPMIGWLLGAVGSISNAPWALRLPAVLLPAILALAVVWLVREVGAASRDREERAWLAGIVFALLPVEVLFALITTDTPLIFFSTLSILAFAAALRNDRVGLYLLAGVFLGLAFLSKYFAALLGVAYVAFAFVSPARERRWRGVAITLAAAVPFGFLNLAWNYGHCWANLMFNAYNRHEGAKVTAKTPLLYLGMLVYVLSPAVLWWLFRERGWAAGLRADPQRRFLATVTGVPFATFALLSLAKTIGLHWLLAFAPAFVALAGLLLSTRALRASATFLAWFSAIHVLATAVVLALPIEAFRSTKWYSGIVMTAAPADFFRALAPYMDEFELAAEGYSPAITMSYNAKRLGFGPRTPGEPPVPHGYVFVYGLGSSHARHDDILTDFRKLDGRNILVVRKTPPPADQYAPYFDSVEYQTIDVRGARYYLVLGRGFRLREYRDGILAVVRDRYYRIPSYLVQGECYFCERYFGTRTCPTR